MRIAEIAPPWFPVPPPGYGGVELVVAQLADRLVEMGHDVTLFANPGSRTAARLVTSVLDPPDPPLVGNTWLDTRPDSGAIQDSLDNAGVPAGWR